LDYWKDLNDQKKGESIDKLLEEAKIKYQEHAQKPTAKTEKSSLIH